jgi:hypothetical protein
MTERTLRRLLGALVAVAGLWLVASLIPRGGGTADAPSGLGSAFEGVDATSVTAVRFMRIEDTIELRPEAGSWRVNGWQADSGSVARFFEAVAEASVGELMATNPGNHERMGVAGDSARTLEIELGGATRTLVVGNEGPRPTTAYARLPGENEVYLLESGLGSHLRRRLNDWRNRRVLAIDTSAVSRITVQRDGDTFTLVRESGEWTFEDGGEASSSQVQSILSEMSGSLVASSVVPEGDPLADQPAGGSTVAYSQSGEVVAEVTIGNTEGGWWATAAGDSVRYRIGSFRADLITPTLESVRPQ